MRYLLTDLEEENAMIEAEEDDLRDFYADVYFEDHGPSIMGDSQADELPVETIIEYLEANNFEIVLIGGN